MAPSARPPTVGVAKNDRFFAGCGRLPARSVPRENHRHGPIYKTTVMVRLMTKVGPFGDRRSSAQRVDRGSGGRYRSLWRSRTAGWPSYPWQAFPRKRPCGRSEAFAGLMWAAWARDGHRAYGAHPTVDAMLSSLCADVPSWVLPHQRWPLHAPQRGSYAHPLAVRVCWGQMPAGSSRRCCRYAAGAP